MTAFFAIVHKDPESAYGVSFPDLEGVFSAADDEEDIVVNACEALQLFAEDQALPSPSTFDELMARQDIRAELANGAFLLRVPFIEKDTRVVRANVTFEAGLLRAIDGEAKRRDLTRAAFLAQAARHEIENSG